MLSDLPNKDTAEERMIGNQSTSSEMRPILPLPFTVQLQNVLPAEIVAKRFPVDTTDNPNVDLRITGIEVDTERLKAQAILEVKVEFSNEPRPFEISFKLVGLFIYPSEYSAEKVHSFSEQGSLSVLLPFARELLFSLCTRLQTAPVLLTLIEVAQPSTKVTKVGNTLE